MQKFITWASVIICGVFVYLYQDAKIGWRNAQSEVVSLRHEMDSLKKKVQEADQQIVEYKKKVEEDSSSIPVETVSAKPSEAAPDAKPHKLKGPDPMGVGALTSKYLIENLEKGMVLSDSEKEQISAKIKESVAQGIPLSGEASAKLLEGVIDDGRYQKYLSETKAKEIRQREEHMQQATSYLAGKLNLSHNQSIQVRQVLDSMREELQPISDGIKQQTAAFRARMMQGDVSQETMVQGHQEMDTAYKNLDEKKKALLNEKLQGLLTEDQYNALLAAQASSEGFIDQATGF